MSERQTPEVDIETFDRGRATGAVIDVREPDEFAAGHVPGARPIPMRHLPARLDELDSSAPVYVVCASGNRSAAMTDLLRSAGFEAFSVIGGTGAWVRSGRPVEEGRA